MERQESSPDEQTNFDLVLLQQHDQLKNINQLLSAVGDKMLKQCLRFSDDNGKQFFIKKSRGYILRPVSTIYFKDKPIIKPQCARYA